MGKISVKTKLFLGILYLICVASLIYFFSVFGFDYKKINFINLLFFSILMILTESFAVPYKSISVSTSFAVQLASLILYGPVFALIVQVIGITFKVAKFNNKKVHVLNTPLYKTLFNYSIVTIPIIAGSIIYKDIGGLIPIGYFAKIGYNIKPLIGFILIYFLLETLIISVLFSLLYNKNFAFTYMSNLKMAGLNILAMVPFSFFLVISYNANNYLGAILVIFPILLVRYTFQLNIKSKSQYLETITALMHAMEARDKYTEGHSERVSELAIGIAKELKFTENHIEDLKIAAMLHDVGKIGIDDSVLNKNGKLTDQEYELIKKHPDIGFNILKDILGIDKVRFIVLHHHERYDGTGYPSGLSPDQLNLEVFIIGLADSIDAMLTDRPYRKARSMDYIISEVKNNRGTQFHPDVVDAYFRYLKKTGGMKE